MIKSSSASGSLTGVVTTTLRQLTLNLAIRVPWRNKKGGIDGGNWVDQSVAKEAGRKNSCLQHNSVASQSPSVSHW